MPLFSAFLWCETFRFDGGGVFGLSCGRGVRGVVAKFPPIVAVVANEVSNLAEGFVRDDYLL